MTITLESLLGALKDNFQHESFLEGQEVVVNKILAGEDICVIMPTGAGKSLCYQLPAILRPGYTIIISPLISLMKDQVDALTEKGIQAVFVNSSLSQKEQEENLNRVVQGDVKLLYAAPERLRSDMFRRMLSANPPDCMVVDEAHCISQWGHDFRPDYHKLGKYANDLDVNQICAFTATATPIVREDIRQQLKRQNMELFVTGFTRPNLSFNIVNCTTKSDKMNFLKSKLSTKTPTIIYCATRKNVDEVAAELNCQRYHAGLSDQEREKSQDYFINDKTPVLAATNAFGMGIDRHDIRQVFHFNMTGSLEAYYQEAGRAGRDGEDAECTILFNFADKRTHEFLIDLNNPDEALIRSVWSVLLRLQKTFKSDSFEMTLNEIANRVPAAKSDQQISGALKVLERNYYIERGFRTQNTGLLKVQGNLDQLQRTHQEIKTQRSRLLTRIIRHYGQDLHEGIEVTYQELEQISSLSGEQVRRVLRALQDEMVDWVPPFAGRSLKILRGNDTDLDIDFSELEKKKALDLQRLQDVIDYQRTGICRQRFLVIYFGQDVGDWLCRVCDKCRKDEHVETRAVQGEEKEDVLILLEAINTFDRLGRNKIAAVLAGSKSQFVVNSYLHKHRLYETLGHLDQPTIIKYIDSLRTADYVRSTGGQYPTLTLTVKGRSVLNQSEDLDIALSVPAKAKSSGRTIRSKQKTESEIIENKEIETNTESEDRPSEQFDELEEIFGFQSGNDDLFEKLKSLRNRICTDLNIQPYQVFNNNALREMAESTPVTKDEMAKIKGVGPTNLKYWGEAFLETIKQWRSDNLK